MTPDERDEDLYKPDSALAMDGGVPPSVWAQKPPAVGAAAPVPIGQLLAAVQSIKTDDDTPPIAPAAPPPPPAAMPPPPPMQAPRPRPQATGFGPGMDMGAINAAYDKQEAAAKQANWARVSDALAQAGGMRPDDSFAQGLESQGKLGLQRVLALQKQAQENIGYQKQQRAAQDDAELDDPNSADTQIARAFAAQIAPQAYAKLGATVNDMTAAQFYRAMPMLKELVTQEKSKKEQDSSEARASRAAAFSTKYPTVKTDGLSIKQIDELEKTLLAEHGSERSDQKETSAEQDRKEGHWNSTKGGVLYNTKTHEKIAPPAPVGGADGAGPKLKEADWARFQNDMKSGRGSPEMTKNEARIDAANGLDALGGSIQNPRNLTGNQMEELATGLQTMLSGGGHSSEAVKRLVPETYWGDAKAWVQKLKNEPTGADQQKFVQNILETVDRERTVAVENNKRIRKQNLGNYIHYREADKARYGALLRGFGIDPDEATPGAGSASKPGGAVKMRFPSGAIHDVPADQVEDAKAKKHATVVTDG